MLTSIASPLTNQNNVHELITQPTTPLPHFVFINLSTKAFREFGSFKHQLPQTLFLAFSSKSVLFCVCICVCVFVCVCACSVVSDSLLPPGLYSLPGSSVHRIFQARLLEWVAISYSKESSQTQGSNLPLLGLLHWQADRLPVCCLESLILFYFTQTLSEIQFGASVQRPGCSNNYKTISACNLFCQYHFEFT